MLNLATTIPQPPRLTAPSLKAEMVRKSGVLFAASTRQAMSPWSRRPVRREDNAPQR